MHMINLSTQNEVNHFHAWKQQNKNKNDRKSIIRVPPLVTQFWSGLTLHNCLKFNFLFKKKSKESKVQAKKGWQKNVQLKEPSVSFEMYNLALMNDVNLEHTGT